MSVCVCVCVCVCPCVCVRVTGEVVEAVVLEHLEQDAQQLPHLGGDALAGEAEGQRQDLLVEL